MANEKRIVTGPEALDLLEKVVTARGKHYIYNDQDEYGHCTYVNEDDAPSCIVAHVINEIDPNLVPVLKTLEGTGVNNLLLPSITFDSEAVQILSIAQDLQDNGSAWGYALERAREHHLYFEASR
jgi:hypothetical protein